LHVAERRFAVNIGSSAAFFAFLAGALMSPMFDAAADDPTPAPAVTPASTSAIYGTPVPTPAPTATINPIELPPAGIEPAKIDLPAVLQRYKASLGTPEHRIDTVREVDDLTAFGITGTETEIDAGKDYVDTRALGPSTTAEGSYQGQRWRRDENGYVRPVNGVHEEDVSSARALQRSILGEESQYVRLLGQVTTPVTAYVVEVDPPAGRHEWLFFDTSSGSLVRQEQADVDRRVVTIYDDFRTTDGIVVPWHVHRSDGFPKNDMDWRISTLDYDVPVSSTELEIPPSRTDAVVFPAGVSDVRIPARIERGHIIIRVVINGRGLDFALDSGAGTIVIDRDVANELGLQTFGLETQTVAGTFDRSSAMIPTMKIGDLTMQDVVVDSLPFQYQADPDTRIVGLLGYDFLAGIVAKVDYWNGTVDAIDRTTFQLPAHDAFELPMALDDQVPMVSATIGSGTGDYFIVDTGSDRVLVFAGFAQDHPDDLADARASDSQHQGMFVIAAGGVGGTLLLEPTMVKAFHFGGVQFQNFVVYQVLGAPAFQGEDADGLIGYEFLEYFDVYFDYADSLLVLLPNRLLTSAH
jgi:hypothetical protein